VTAFKETYGKLCFTFFLYFDNIGIMEINDAVARLSALAQNSRLEVFKLLVRRAPTPVAAGEIAEAMSLANATLSFQLKELTHSGLLVSRQEGRRVLYTPNFEAMQELMAYLMENCCADSDENAEEDCCEPV
jgi:DNA-binding transcriptional ArsR family regulator